MAANKIHLGFPAGRGAWCGSIAAGLSTVQEDQRDYITCKKCLKVLEEQDRSRRQLAKLRERMERQQKPQGE